MKISVLYKRCVNLFFYSLVILLVLEHIFRFRKLQIVIKCLLSYFKKSERGLMMKIITQETNYILITNNLIINLCKTKIQICSFQCRFLKIFWCYQYVLVCYFILVGIIFSKKIILVLSAKQNYVLNIACV